MQYAHDAAGTPTPAAADQLCYVVLCYAERPGLTKQKQDRRHLARRRIAARERQLTAGGVGRHRQAERLRHLLRRRQLRLRDPFQCRASLTA